MLCNFDEGFEINGFYSAAKFVIGRKSEVFSTPLRVFRRAGQVQTTPKHWVFSHCVTVVVFNYFTVNTSYKQ